MVPAKTSTKNTCTCTQTTHRRPIWRSMCVNCIVCPSPFITQCEVSGFGTTQSHSASSIVWESRPCLIPTNFNMTVSVHVRPLSTEELRHVLAGDPSDSRVLLVDSRPFMQFNENHITGAHNIHCPRLLRRRSKGPLAMDYIITCPKTKAELLAGLFSTVVVYDERTVEVGRSTEKSSNDLILVLESLLHAPFSHLTTEITFLQGKITFIVSNSNIFSWVFLSTV